MYRALGDKQKQQELRIANPGGQHCTLLMADSTACTGCHKNPRKDEQKKPEGVDEADEDWAPWISSTSRLLGLLHAGVTITLADLTPETEAMLLAAQQEISAFEKYKANPDKAPAEYREWLRDRG